MLSVEEILTRGVTNIVVREELDKKLASGKPIRVKLGIDPTGARLHIGRAIPLWKMRNLQDLGHQIVMIIGDFTAMIGDASDKDAERKMLTREEIQENMKGYIDQIGMILDMSKVELHYNSEWLEKLNFNDIAELAQNFSVAQMLDRDNFSKRFESGQRIGLQEFLYPLMQGYDSVAIQADLELGGNDQYFNLMAGRILQKACGQDPQSIMTFELINGLDGRKMSTSYGNIIALLDEPNDQFGKIMSMSDDLIIKYLEVCTQMPVEKIQNIKKDLDAGMNPRDAKMILGMEIVRLYHGEEAAIAAKDAFISQFSDKNKPTDIPIFTPKEQNQNIVDCIVEAGLETSKSNARRLVEAGGVKINDEKIDDILHQIHFENNMIIQAGKRRYIKIVF